MVLRTKRYFAGEAGNNTTVGAQGYKDVQKETRIPGRGNKLPLRYEGRT